MSDKFLDAQQFSDLQALVLGQCLGAGISRTTYVYRPDPQYVIKHENKMGWHQNIAEYEVWDWVRGSKMERWFAPVIDMSPCGVWLVMARCEPLRKQDLPKKLPAFMLDIQQTNFGLYRGKVVARDYGLGVGAIREASRRMVKADWTLDT